MAGAVANRYARAVFELGQETGEVDAWSERLSAVRALLTNPEVVAVVSNPTLPVQQRQDVVEAVASEAMGPGGLNLAKLLVGTGRAHLIGDVVDEFERLADDAAGRVRATATTAVELSPAEKKALAERLAERLGKEVRLEVRIDPRVLGGMVLRYGDRLVDASLATRLQQLRRGLAGA